MSYAETRKQVEAEIDRAERVYNAAYRRLDKKLQGLNREWIKAGVWEFRGKDGKWRTVKLKKAKQAKPDMRFASGKRDTALPEIAAAGKPGSEGRIAAMIAFYANPENAERSAFTITDEEITEGLVGLIAGKVQHAAYDVDAIDSLDE